jgi:ssDNA-binding Zn-finger/Zn-ribbon topoisomerase 1
MKKTLVDFYSKKYYEAEVKFRELKLDLEKKELLLSEAQDRISKLEQTPAFSNVSGQICAECKRKDEIIKWSRFYTDLRDKVNCIHCEEIIPCEECKTYKELLKEHKLDTAQN